MGDTDGIAIQVTVVTQHVCIQDYAGVVFQTIEQRIVRRYRGIIHRCNIDSFKYRYTASAITVRDDKSNRATGNIRIIRNIFVSNASYYRLNRSSIRKITRLTSSSCSSALKSVKFEI